MATRSDNPARETVLIEIGYGESELRERVKGAEGFWNPGKKAWVLSWRRVVEPGLEKRTID